METFFNLLSINLCTESIALNGAIRSINPPNCIILGNYVSESFLLADESFSKALRSFETCVLVNNNLCGKLVSSLELPVKFDERFKFTLVRFVIAHFKLLSCELDNLTYKCYIESFYIILKPNKLITL